MADAPAQLLALLARLAPLDCREGGLRESLLRRAPTMLAAMHCASRRRRGSAPPRRPSRPAPPSPHAADCAVCAAPLPSAGAPAAPHPPNSAPPLHCLVCHAALPPWPLPSLAARAWRAMWRHAGRRTHAR